MLGNINYAHRLDREASPIELEQRKADFINFLQKEPIFRSYEPNFDS